jgi:D-hydroxyproline dehydrogenase subunit alpha
VEWEFVLNAAPKLMEYRIAAVVRFPAPREWKLEVSSPKHFDVLVVGGGPAGIAAALSAARSGARVGLADDNPALGGQIWRGEDATEESEAASWIKKIREAGVDLLCGVRVFDQPSTNVLRAETVDGFCEFEYRSLILATGARERFLPFPGWTLPNVMGAGGLQALVKSGLPIKGKRIVIAGTGPLLLAVAAYLKKKGAQIVAICEQASLASLAKFGIALLRYGNKIGEALEFRRDLKEIRFLPNSWAIAAEGDELLRSVLISHTGSAERIACDYLACGFHLVPNIELAALLGCRLQNGFVQVDEFQRTSISNVFCAGEPTGIGGLELSLVEGQIAGFAAGGQLANTGHLFSKRQKLQKFARALDSTFRLRPELKDLPNAETIVCRCEDVAYDKLKQYRSWRAAKLQTRCGMGPCQGRVCGPVNEFLFGWKPDSIRPPIFPVTLANLAAAAQPEANSELSGVIRGES